MCDQARLKPLADIAELRSEKLSGRKPQDAPYLGLEHIDSDSGDLNSVGAATDSVSTNCVFLRGDILFGKLRPNLRKCVQAPFDGFGSTDILVLRSVDTVDGRFAAWVFQQEAVFRRAERTAIGTKMPRTSWRDLRQIEVFIPDSETEQQRIALILDALDTAIRETETLIAKLRKIKAGLLHDLLSRGIDENGELRDPVSRPEEFQHSRLGFLPVEWTLKTLGDALQEHGGRLQTGPFGSQLHAHEYVAQGIPVIMPQDISDGCIMAEKIAYVSEAKALSMKRHLLQFGDIVFSRRGELSRAAAAKTEHIGWICGTGCFLLRVSQQYIDSQWLAHVYRHDRTQRQVLAGAVGSTMLSLNNAIMAELIIPWPQLDEQREIVRRLNDYDESILREEMQLQKLAKLKSGLMHDLLTGKIRVLSLGTTA